MKVLIGRIVEFKNNCQLDYYHVTHHTGIPVPVRVYGIRIAFKGRPRRPPELKGVGSGNSVLIATCSQSPTMDNEEAHIQLDEPFCFEEDPFKILQCHSPPRKRRKQEVKGMN